MTQSRLAQLSGLSRQTLVGLEAGALSDLGFNRVAKVLAVLGLDLDPPSQAARARKRGLWMAAKNPSVSYVQEVPLDTLGHALVSGSVPNGYAAHLTHLLDEAPVPLVVMAVEEAAANEGVPLRLCGTTSRSWPGHWPCSGRACGRDDSVMKSLPSGP